MRGLSRIMAIIPTVAFFSSCMMDKVVKTDLTVIISNDTPHVLEFREIQSSTYPEDGFVIDKFDEWLLNKEKLIPEIKLYYDNYSAWCPGEMKLSIDGGDPIEFSETSRETSFWSGANFTFVRDVKRRSLKVRFTITENTLAPYMNTED